jgi:hypothetical protein
MQAISGLTLRVRECQAAVLEANRHRSTLFQFAEQDFVRKRIAYFLLNETAERPRAERGIVAFRSKP